MTHNVRIKEVKDRLSIIKELSFGLSDDACVISRHCMSGELRKRRRDYLRPVPKDTRLYYIKYRSGLVNLTDISLLANFRYLGQKVFNVTMKKDKLDDNYLLINFI